MNAPPRITPEEEAELELLVRTAALCRRLSELSESQHDALRVNVSGKLSNELHHPFVATLLCVVMEQVHAGGKLSIVGSGPLSAPGQRGYDATLTSHTGARHAAAHGSSLGLCLEQLVLRWGKL